MSRCTYVYLGYNSNRLSYFSSTLEEYWYPHFQAHPCLFSLAISPAGVSGHFGQSCAQQGGTFYWGRGLFANIQAPQNCPSCGAQKILSVGSGKHMGITFEIVRNHWIIRKHQVRSGPRSASKYGCKSHRYLRKIPTIQIFIQTHIGHGVNINMIVKVCQQTAWQCSKGLIRVEGGSCRSDGPNAELPGMKI